MPETLTLVEKTAFLKSVEAFASIPTEALSQLAARTGEIHCDPGDVLFAEGEPNRGAFLVVEGLIELRKGKTLVHRLREGMAFGELFLEQDEPHQYTAVAAQPSHVLNLESQEVFEGMREFPEFGVAMVRTLALRNQELTRRVLELEQALESPARPAPGDGAPPSGPRRAAPRDEGPGGPGPPSRPSGTKA